MILWNPTKVCLELIDSSPQAIHCSVSCKVTSVSFKISFVYALHSVVSKRPLWNNLVDISVRINALWLILGDFNSVLKEEKKCNGMAVSAYESKDIQDCFLTAGLSNLPSVGCFFTWSNNSVWSKLDRALVNNEWLIGGLKVQALFPPSGCLSDHSPCIVSLVNQGSHFRKPFKFFNMWASHENFQSVVNGDWYQSDCIIEGTEQFILSRKLQRLKGPFKKFNSQHFSLISARADAANSALKAAQLELQSHPSDSDLQHKVVGLRKSAMNLNEAERHFYWQKAKCKFLLNSDRCTKFFHAFVKRNAKRNFIASVRKDDGSFTDSLQQVANEFVSYYKKLFGFRVSCVLLDHSILRSGNDISSGQAASIIRSVSHQEIKKTFFSIGDDKDPGPDGFSSGFFKKCWHTVGDQCSKAVKEFFVSRALLKQFNHTAISLIPKSSHA